MTNTSALDPHDAALFGRDVDDLILQIRGLVLVRDILAERGATSAEIRAHTEAAERLREHLAELIRG
jgi:hypothetical protein